MCMSCINTQDRENSVGSLRSVSFYIVFETKVLYCALTGCKGMQNRAPGNLSMCSPLYKSINTLENMYTRRVH